MAAQKSKPNILFIMGDDIGWFNISAYNHGIMGYRTPNIDRIAKEGAMFTDWYGQQSCTAGRAAFITGQSPIRTGLTKVGLPGADIGLRAEDPTVADVLKSARRRGSDVIMSMDAYKAFCAKYDPARKPGAVEHKGRSKIVVPKVEPKPILGPTGLPLQKACCGAG